MCMLYVYYENNLEGGFHTIWFVFYIFFSDFNDKKRISQRSEVKRRELGQIFTKVQDKEYQ